MTIMKVRRGTAAQWTSANTVLSDGELGLEQDTASLKVGDGTTAWNSLAYLTMGNVGEQLVTWTGTNWVYNRKTISARPTTPTYNQGARIIWDSSLDSTMSTPPTLAIAGDIWHPHHDVLVALSS